MAEFAICRTCGKIIEIVKNGAPDTVCCGKPMEVLVPGKSDGAAEKHVPVVTREGDRVLVNVGSVDHPMQDVHYIEWIALETDRGITRKSLKPGEKPFAAFTLTDEKPVAVYAYCNLHGLWKTEL